MGNTQSSDSVDSSAGNPEAEKKKEQESTSPLTQGDQIKLLEEIIYLETRIEILHQDYEMMTECLEDETQSLTVEKVIQEKPKAQWHRKAALKVARLLAGRPECKPAKIEQTHLTAKEKKHISMQARDVQLQIEKLTAERDEKMAKLDTATRIQHEAKSNVVHIRDFIARRSGRVLELSEEEPKGEIQICKRPETTTLTIESKTEAEYYRYIDGLRLNAEQKEKLRGIVKGYEESVTTAKGFDPDIVIPPKELVIARIMALGGRQLEKIAFVMSKPQLIIDPANRSLEQMIDDMELDSNKHCDNQEEILLIRSYKWSAGRKKVSISIADMCQHPSVVPGQEPGIQCNGEQLRICERYFRAEGMELMHDYQYAIGMQRSLRAYEKANTAGEINPGNHIIDFSYDATDETMTAFYREHKFTLDKIGCGFITNFRPSGRVTFFWFPTNNKTRCLRGRAVVKVIEL